MPVQKKFLFMMAVAAGVCWGTYGTFATIMNNYGISEGAISMIAPLGYGLFFLILLFKDNIRKIAVKRKLIPVVLFYGAQSAVFNFSLVKAYLFLPLGIVSTIVFCNLFLLMIFCRILFKDKITWQKGVAAGFAVLGIALVLNVFDLNVSWNLQGLLWTGLALLCWALMVASEKYMLNEGVDGNAVMVFNGFFAVLFLCFYTAPWVVFANIGTAVAVSHGMVLLPTVAFILVTSIGTYFFYITALKHLEASIVQLGFVMDPLTASILGFFVFGQALRPIQILGILLIISVVLWVEWLEVKAERAVAFAKEI
jgi:drug/metabolite transporter (DMT)-like permease